jgi:hypothetical protein
VGLTPDAVPPADTTAASPTAALARRAIVVATSGNLLAYATAFAPGGAPRWAAWLFAGCTVLLMTAIIVLGAARGRAGIGALRVPVALMACLLLGGFAAALALPPVTADSPLWLGLPPAAAAVIYGVGLLPILVLPVAYARTFDALTLTDADLARVRAAGARHRAAAATAATAATGEGDG